MKTNRRIWIVSKTQDYMETETVIFIHLNFRLYKIRRRDFEPL